MGLLIIGVAAGFLIGYGLVPLQASLQDCSWQDCFDRLVASQSIDPKSGPPAAIAGAKPATAAKSRKPSSAGSAARADLVKTADVPPSKSDAAASDRPAENSDPVLDKAKTAVAAKMEDPASAEFGDMKRAMRKNTLGKRMDTICGHVRGKDASGSDTGDRPFLYLVKEDDAYVVGGKTNWAAAIAHRNICK
jgi:hypothetical protein